RAALGVYGSFRVAPRTLSSALFPYTTLFRSRSGAARWRTVPHHGKWGAPESLRSRPPAPSLRPAHRLLPRGGRWWRIRETHSARSEEHTSELQSREKLVCRLPLEKKQRAAHP